MPHFTTWRGSRGCGSWAAYKLRKRLVSFLSQGDGAESGERPRQPRVCRSVGEDIGIYGSLQRENFGDAQRVSLKYSAKGGAGHTWE